MDGTTAKQAGKKPLQLRQSFERFAPRHTGPKLGNDEASTAFALASDSLYYFISAAFVAADRGEEKQHGKSEFTFRRPSFDRSRRVTRAANQEAYLSTSPASLL